MFTVDINIEARAVGCGCPDNRTGMFRKTVDELVEFVQAPSLDELADTLVTASRALASALRLNGRFFTVPFQAIRLTKERARLEAHGCIRSSRHLVDGACPNKPVNDARVPTVCLDFDGVINSYTTSFNGDHADLPDPPEEGSLEFVKRCEDNGIRVVVCSVRASYPEGKKAVVDYLARYGFPALHVTATKPLAEVYVDDRGFRYEGNFSELDPVALVTMCPHNRSTNEK